MQIAILIFDKLTALDAIGPYEVLRSVPGWEVKFVAPAKGEVRTDSGALGLSADYSLDEVTEADIVLVPGGEGNRPLMTDEAVLSWLRQVDHGDQVDDLGLHRLPRPRRRRAAGGQAGDLPLALPRAAARVRRRPGRRALRRGRQDDHRRRRLGRDRHGAAPGRPGGRPRGRPGRPARDRVRPAAALRRRLPAKAPAPIVEAVTAIAGPGDEWLGPSA